MSEIQYFPILIVGTFKCKIKFFKIIYMTCLLIPINELLSLSENFNGKEISKFGKLKRFATCFVIALEIISRGPN